MLHAARSASGQDAEQIEIKSFAMPSVENFISSRVAGPRGGRGPAGHGARLGPLYNFLRSRTFVIETGDKFLEAEPAHFDTSP